MKSLVLCDDTNIEVVAQLCKKRKCGIEVQSFFTQRYLENNPDGINIHKRYIDGLSIASLHGPFHDLCPGSNDELIRDATLRRYEYAYEKAVLLGINHIVLHHGYVPRTSSYNGWLKRTVEFWQSFLAGKSDKVMFHIENQLEYNPMLLSEVVAGIDARNVDVCLDIGHAHCNSHTSVQDWIRHLNKQIGYVHMHDNHGEDDEHIGFGKGNIPLVEVCQALEEYTDAIWAIETNTDDIEQSILWLHEHGYSV